MSSAADGTREQKQRKTWWAAVWAIIGRNADAIVNVVAWPWLISMLAAIAVLIIGFCDALPDHHTVPQPWPLPGRRSEWGEWFDMDLIPMPVFKVAAGYVGVHGAIAIVWALVELHRAIEKERDR